jgi:hypothetical protein
MLSINAVVYPRRISKRHEQAGEKPGHYKRLSWFNQPLKSPAIFNGGHYSNVQVAGIVLGHSAQRSP